jgi:hypothetical protein
MSFVFILSGGKLTNAAIIPAPKEDLYFVYDIFYMHLVVYESLSLVYLVIVSFIWSYEDIIPKFMAIALRTEGELPLHKENIPSSLMILVKAFSTPV